MRNIEATNEYIKFVEAQNDQFKKKLDYLLQKIKTEPQISQKVVEKIVNSDFYELKIKMGNQYRILIFAIDHADFQKCTEILLLNGFHKKGKKDYPKAVKKAYNLLAKYTK